MIQRSAIGVKVTWRLGCGVCVAGGCFLLGYLD